MQHLVLPGFRLQVRHGGLGFCQQDCVLADFAKTPCDSYHLRVCLGQIIPIRAMRTPDTQHGIKLTFDALEAGFEYADPLGLGDDHPLA